MAGFEELSNDPFEEALRKLEQGDQGKVENTEQLFTPEPSEKHEEKSTIGNEIVDKRNLQILLEIEVDVTMEIGRANMLLSDLLLLGQGSVIELDRLVGDDLDILIGDKKIGTAEVMISQEKFGARLKTVVPHKERLESLKK